MSLGGFKVGELYATLAIDDRMVDRTLDGMDGKAKGVAGRMSGYVKGAMAGMAGAALGRFAWEGVKAAGDLDEALNKSTVIFRESSKAVDDWAQHSQYAIYFTRQAANEYAATLGNLLQGEFTLQEKAKMSMTLTERAADLASLHNTTVEEALESMRSGLVGETEPLRKYGIQLSAAKIEAEALRLGLIKEGQALDETAKSRAIYSLILRESNVAAGDAINTQDSLSNKLKQAEAAWHEIKVEIGSEFLPVMTDAAKQGVAFLRVIRPMIPLLIKGGIAFGGLWAAVKGYGILKEAVGAGRDLLSTLRLIPPVSGRASGALVDLGDRGAKGLMPAIGRTSRLIGLLKAIGPAAALAAAAYATWEAAKVSEKDTEHNFIGGGKGGISRGQSQTSGRSAGYGESAGDRIRKALATKDANERAKPLQWSLDKGWFANGGDFVANSPMVIGVGDRRERVQITPLDGSRGAGGGAQITIAWSTFTGRPSRREIEGLYRELARAGARLA
jgi:hypothetical protein